MIFLRGSSVSLASSTVPYLQMRLLIKYLVEFNSLYYLNCSYYQFLCMFVPIVFKFGLFEASYDSYRYRIDNLQCRTLRLGFKLRF